MKFLALCALSITLLTPLASAQKMGGINRNAPTIEQSLQAGDLSVELNYSAINFGMGAWHDALQDKSKRNAMRERINKGAKSAPLASFECDDEVLINGILLAEGEYAVSFTLNEEFAWELVFSDDETTVTVPLELEKGEQPSKRLVLSLHAGDEDGTAGIYLGFGDYSGVVVITPAPESDDDEDDEDDK